MKNLLSLFFNLPGCRRTLLKAAKFLIYFTLAYSCLVISIFQSIQIIRTKKEQVAVDSAIQRKMSCGVNFFNDSSSEPFVKRIKIKVESLGKLTKSLFLFSF